MRARHKLLLTISLAVLLLDQGSKLLAVKHLTPGLSDIAVAAAIDRGEPAPETPAAALQSFPMTETLRHFYGSVKHPCRGRSGCPTVEVVPGFWNHRYVENPGAAWGLLSNASEAVRVPFFLLVTVGAMVFILSLFRRLEDGQRLLMVALALVFGGALGNLVDRLHLTYVIDFIDWHVGDAHWPTFNVADAGITVGVGLLMLEWLREARQARGAEQKS
jgi:signal peptidase II